jgi:hypothetical protein
MGSRRAALFGICATTSTYLIILGI